MKTKEKTHEIHTQKRTARLDLLLLVCAGVFVSIILYGCFNNTTLSNHAITGDKAALQLKHDGSKSDSDDTMQLFDIHNPDRTAVIVLGYDALPSEKTAATELAKYLKLITDTVFPVVSSAMDGKPAIYVGQTSASKSMLPGFDWNSLKADGILIKTMGKNIVLAGDRPRGTMYAVYTFLEDYLGCRWWTPEVEAIPRKTFLSVGAIDYKYTPPFFYRDTFFKKVKQQNPAYCVKMKLNGNFSSIPEEWGGSHSFAGFCHTFGRLLPPSKYFAAHPEWFSEINGKRLFDQSEDAQRSQLCLSNQEMKQELIRNALKTIRATPSASIVSISQNDAPTSYCQCDKCKAAVAKYGGIQSGLILEFVNSVAEEIEKSYPDIWVETLAYQYSRNPPINIVPRKNVLIRLSTIECDFSQPLNSHTNQEFHDNIVAWKKLAPRLFIWDYIVNFKNFHLPHPNINIMAENIRFFADNNAVGVFEQGDGFIQDAQFTPLKTYLAAKQMWNPCLDAEKVKLEFLNGYYGKAGSYLNDYIKLLQTAVLREKFYLKEEQETTPWLHAPDYIAAFKLFENAMNEVRDNPEQIERVRTERRSLEFAFVISSKMIKDEVLASKVIEPMDDVAWAGEFLKWAKTTKNNWSVSADYSPNMDMEYFRLKGFFGIVKGSKPSAIAGIPDKNWMDVQNNLFWLHQIGTSSKQITDEKASDKSAAQIIKCDNGDWSIRVPLDVPVRNELDEVNVVVQMRMKAKGMNNAVKVGIYDGAYSKVILEKIIKANELTDEYADIHLEKHKLTAGMCLYIAPMNNYDVETITVDRIYVYKDAVIKE